MFACGFETRIKTVLPLINRLINEALLVADHVSITCSLISDKHVPACQFQSVSRRWCNGVVFMQPGVKVNGAYYCDVLLICQAAGDFCFPLQCIMRVQEH